MPPDNRVGRDDRRDRAEAATGIVNLRDGGQSSRMLNDLVRYPRYRFPPAIISHAVWLYYRFTLSFRDVEDLLAHRGITVSYESIRHWCETFALAYARRRRQGD